MSIDSSHASARAREVSLVIGELLATTRELRTLARELLGEGRSDALEARTSSIDGALHRMQGSLDAAVVEDAPVETRACPSCGQTIRAAALRCGHCWTKLA